MRKNETLHHIPVIIVSGSVPTPGVMPPQGSYQAFIEKPFDLTDVNNTVNRLAGSKAACA